VVILVWRGFPTFEGGKLWRGFPTLWTVLEFLTMAGISYQGGGVFPPQICFLNVGCGAVKTGR
jgi:hypothetical protein